MEVNHLQSAVRGNAERNRKTSSAKTKEPQKVKHGAKNPIGKQRRKVGIEISKSPQKKKRKKKALNGH